MLTKGLVMSERKKNYLFLILGVAVIVLLDQVTKIVVVNNMELNESIPWIKDVFEIHYIQNSGMAWGLFKDRTWLLAIFSVVMIAGLLYVYNNVSEGKYYRLLRFLLLCIIGGAVGNLIDRIRLNYVIDFFYFKLIDFPVFNVADIFVTVSVILLLILLIFKYRKDLDVMLGDKVRLSDGTYVEKKSKKQKETTGLKEESAETKAEESEPDDAPESEVKEPDDSEKENDGDS